MLIASIISFFMDIVSVIFLFVATALLFGSLLIFMVKRAMLYFDLSCSSFLSFPYHSTLYDSPPR